ncbi:MAG TPA: bacteriohemerythrin [Dissulfurispiraceae bacterium]|nr:bacteriohemerythrin [Dissulfurispiraceae bacterium]
MIAWHDDLSVGVAEIDEQHKELIARVVRLLSALDQRAAENEIRDLFTFLESYVVVHFGTEERYMKDYGDQGYPYAHHHKSEHKAFIRDFREFRADLDGALPAQIFINEFARWISNWYKLHIEKVDKGLGAFLQSAGNKTK